MAQRAIWLVSHGPGAPQGGAVRFSRRYPTVEKRAKTFNGSSYVPLPEDESFCKALLFELRLLDDDKDFVESRDSCSRISKASVYGLPIGGKELWPVLALQKNGLIYVSVPLVEQTLSTYPPLISINGISQAFDLLFGLIDFINSGPKTEADLSTKVNQLPDLLLHVCPFGTLLDTNFSVDNFSNLSLNQSPNQPAWKVGTYKGKPHVAVSITEKVKSMQYDKRDVEDMWQVYGTVTCKVRLYGAF
ncbi:AP-5 complex subunit mu-1-like [Macrotis lagotis]|uniref:AP-5 complex subunit mu-1-like n=1 Tax=Macrotis lagotis TaxID=92651 RepID=UPI003D68731D